MATRGSDKGLALTVTQTRGKGWEVTLAPQAPSVRLMKAWSVKISLGSRNQYIFYQKMRRRRENFKDILDFLDYFLDFLQISVFGLFEMVLDFLKLIFGLFEIEKKRYVPTLLY